VSFHLSRITPWRMDVRAIFLAVLTKPYASDVLSLSAPLSFTVSHKPLVGRSTIGTFSTQLGEVLTGI
jgi:hypothetical protein